MDLYFGNYMGNINNLHARSNVLPVWTFKCSQLPNNITNFLPSVNCCWWDGWAFFFFNQFSHHSQAFALIQITLTIVQMVNVVLAAKEKLTTSAYKVASEWKQTFTLWKMFPFAVSGCTVCFQANKQNFHFVLLWLFCVYNFQTSQANTTKNKVLLLSLGMPFVLWGKRVAETLVAEFTLECVCFDALILSTSTCMGKSTCTCSHASCYNVCIWGEKADSPSRPAKNSNTAILKVLILIKLYIKPFLPAGYCRYSINILCTTDAFCYSVFLFVLSPTTHTTHFNTYPTLSTW